jgi:hypothetical protein
MIAGGGHAKQLIDREEFMKLWKEKGEGETAVDSLKAALFQTSSTKANCHSCGQVIADTAGIDNHCSSGYLH